MIKKYIFLCLIFFLLFSCKKYVVINSKNINNNSDFKEYGKIKFKETIIIYQTETVLKKYPDHSTDSIIRFYIRDLYRKFNKEIFEVLNTPDFGGGTYGEIIKQKYLKINRIAPGHATTIIKLDGSPLKKKIEEEYGVIKLFSPDKKYLAISTYNDLLGNTKYKPNTVLIKNLKNNIIDEYDFFEVGLNGIYMGGFTNDSNFLYICGGRYEFGADANLWKIDINNKSIYKYKDIDELSYPIYLFINEDVAFINNQKYQFIDGFQKIDLYQLNLDNNDLELILSENAICAFYDFIKIDNFIFFGIETDYLKYQYIQMNLKDKSRKIIFNELINVIEYSKKDKWILVQTNQNFKVIFPFKDQEIILGKGREIGFAVPDDNKEYIDNIVGIIEY